MQEIAFQLQRGGHAGRSPLVRLRTQFTGRAVERVAHHGMAERRDMNANLVGAPGFDLHFEKSELAIGRVNLLLYQVMRNCITAAESASRHARPFLRMAADRALYHSAPMLWPTVHEGNIGLMHGALAEL